MKLNDEQIAAFECTRRRIVTWKTCGSGMTRTELSTFARIAAWFARQAANARDHEAAEMHRRAAELAEKQAQAGAAIRPQLYRGERP